MSAEDKARGWLSVADAARYAGVAEHVIREAIASGELAAYERPVVRERTRSRTLRRHLRVSIADIDAWVRDTWEPAEVAS